MMRFLNGLLVIFVCGTLLTMMWPDSLPLQAELLQVLYQQPEQEPTTLGAFTQEYGDKRYMLTPRFSYRLFGMVVSYQNLDEHWFNTYYDHDPMNIKDVCVIWGGNLGNEDYQKINYSSGLWVCYVQYNDPTLVFNMSQLSNNHLLPANPEVAKAIREAKKGDQIFLEGYLVDYYQVDQAGTRKTSTVRTDTGDGACEVIFVKDFKILRNANGFKEGLHTFFFWGFVLLLIVRSGFFIHGCLPPPSREA